MNKSSVLWFNVQDDKWRKHPQKCQHECYLTGLRYHLFILTLTNRCLNLKYHKLHSVYWASTNEGNLAGKSKHLIRHVAGNILTASCSITVCSRCGN